MSAGAMPLLFSTLSVHHWANSNLATTHWVFWLWVKDSCLDPPAWLKFWNTRGFFAQNRSVWHVFLTSDLSPTSHELSFWFLERSVSNKRSGHQFVMTSIGIFAMSPQYIVRLMRNANNCVKDLLYLCVFVKKFMYYNKAELVRYCKKKKN